MLEIYESIPGVIAPKSPFPNFILANQHVFQELERPVTIIDIGAGSGRFMSYFLGIGWPTRGKKIAKVDLPVERYVAIEPDPKRKKTLLEIAKKGKAYQRSKFGIDPEVEVVINFWENVRDNYIDDYFSITILWEVLMFMDLTTVHEPPEDLSNSEKKLYAILEEVPYWVGMTKDIILLALFPVKNNIFGVPIKELKDYFKRIVSKFLNYTEIIAKKDWKFILKVI